MRVLHLFKLHISQMHPLGVARIRHFEFMCRSFQMEPPFNLFPAFYKVSKSDDWYSFTAAPNVPVCLFPPKSVGTTVSWKRRFFWVNESAIPTLIPSRPDPNRQIRQVTPNVERLSQSPLYNLLTGNPSENGELSEHALVHLLMSNHWDQARVWPIYFDRRDDGKCYYFQT